MFTHVAQSKRRSDHRRVDGIESPRLTLTKGLRARPAGERLSGTDIHANVDEEERRRGGKGGREGDVSQNIRRPPECVCGCVLP